MGQLADRLAFLTKRYGSDPQAWQHEIHALAALEGSDTKAALARFHALKRRLAEFRRADLLRELRGLSFVEDVPSADARGYPLSEIEAEIRQATRALAHARRIERALAEEAEARAALSVRALDAPGPLGSARWDALGVLEERAEERRRAAKREARLERRLREATARERRLLHPLGLPDPGLPAEALDAALDALEPRLDAAERLEEAHARAVAPLRAPEVREFRHATRRGLEREADDLLVRGDVDGLAALGERAEALRREAAALGSQAARSRRAGRAPPERERRPSDGVDPYG